MVGSVGRREGVGAACLGFNIGPALYHVYYFGQTDVLCASVPPLKYNGPYLRVVRTCELFRIMPGNIVSAQKLAMTNF